VEDIAFRVLAADNQPNFRTISDFRKIYLKTMEGLVEQVLKIALEAGALKVGRVALDGTKIKANASKHKAMSYDRMKKKEKDLRSQIKDLLAQADAGEDAATPVPDPCDTPPRRRMIRRELNTADAIAVNQQLRHHPRVVRRLAALLTAVHLIHRRKIELIDHVADDTRQMILRQPLPAGSAAAANHMSV
jgi:hypothetical protein